MTKRGDDHARAAFGAGREGQDNDDEGSIQVVVDHGVRAIRRRQRNSRLGRAAARSHTYQVHTVEARAIDVREPGMSRGILRAIMGLMVLLFGCVGYLVYSLSIHKPSIPADPSVAQTQIQPQPVQRPQAKEGGGTVLQVLPSPRAPERDTTRDTALVGDTLTNKTPAHDALAHNTPVHNTPVHDSSEPAPAALAVQSIDSAKPAAPVSSVVLSPPAVAQPVTSAHSAQPVVSTQSVASAQPVVPIQPANAVQPAASVPSAAPVQHAAPIQPSVASQAVASVKPAALIPSAGLPQPAVAAQTAASAQPATSTPSADLPQPAVAAQTVAPAKPAVVFQSADSVPPAVSPRPTVAAQSVASVNPSSAAQTVASVDLNPPPQSAVTGKKPTMRQRSTMAYNYRRSRHAVGESPASRQTGEQSVSVVAIQPIANPSAQTDRSATTQGADDANGVGGMPLLRAPLTQSLYPDGWSYY